MYSEQKGYPLRAIYLNPTDHCNLKCRHCWLSPETVEMQPNLETKKQAYTCGVSVEQIRDLIHQAKPLGLHAIKLTGGEPFLRSDIMDFISLFHSEGIYVDIETNGTLIDESTASGLKKNQVGCISVSLDGATAESHDRFRGVDGAFESAIRGIRHLRDCDLVVQVIMSLCRENVDEIADISMLASNLGVQSLKINPLLPIGRAHKMYETGITLSAEELIEISRWVDSHLQPKVGVPISFCMPIAFQPIKAIMENGQPECPVLNILGIVENGDISFCGIEHVEKDLIMGNINKDRLETIWLNHPLLKAMRESIPWRLEGICGKCIFKKTCLGSCRACAYYMDKSLTAPFWLCQEAFEKGLFPETRYCH